MTKYIDADIFRAKITDLCYNANFQQQRAMEESNREDFVSSGGEIFAYAEVLSLITSLQQEQSSADALVKMIWHKESDHPNNKHPYPVINPDGEMAFAYYDGIYGWQFDRDFPHSVNMMWLDIEMILPFKDNDSISTNTSTDMKTDIDLELEKEIDEKWDEFVSSEGEREDFTNIVRHFYERGIKARPI